MEKTLYEGLVELDSSSKILLQMRENFRMSHKTLADRITIDVLTTPEIKKRQIELLEKYGSPTNPLLVEAMGRRKTATQYLEELSRVNRGIRRFLPHGLDKTHNERVKQIDELVGRTGLETNGFLFPDNFVGGIGLMTPLSYGAFTAFEYLANLSAESPLKFPILSMSVAVGVLAGIALQFIREKTTYPREKEANHIDARIQELRHY